MAIMRCRDSFSTIDGLEKWFWGQISSKPKLADKSYRALTVMKNVTVRVHINYQNESNNFWWNRYNWYGLLLRPSIPEPPKNNSAAKFVNYSRAWGPLSKEPVLLSLIKAQKRPNFDPTIANLIRVLKCGYWSYHKLIVSDYINIWSTIHYQFCLSIT